ncbi:MAG: hypothetical protein WCG99_03920 [Candidatus Berkelbacteria bacterium]
MNILLIESVTRHAEAGKLALEAAGHQVEVLTDYDSVKIRAGVDVVVSEVFLDWHQGDGHPAQPWGLAVAAICQQCGVPIILTMAGFHHSSWQVMAKAVAEPMKWPIVDTPAASSNYTGPKDWPEVIQQLRRIVMSRQ